MSGAARRLLPGLGPLRDGDVVGGLTLLLLDGWWVAAAIEGGPRLGVVTGLAHGRPSAHGLLAVVAWALLGAGLPAVAWRAPRPPSAAPLARAWRRLRAHPSGRLGLLGVAQVLALAVLAPLLAPFDPDAVGVGAARLAPGGLFLLGTDVHGRDLWSRVLLGARVTVGIGVLAVAIAATIGAALGALAGYVGGVVDRLVSYGVDLVLSVPRLVLLLAVVGLLRPHGGATLGVVVALLGLTGWTGVARVARAEVRSLRDRDFVTAARVLGLRPSRILLGHLLPNALGPVIVQATLALGATMLAEASLSFLGLGVQPPTSTWGTLVAEGRHDLHAAPWIALAPGVALALTALSFNLLGDGLRDALDPRHRNRLG